MPDIDTRACLIGLLVVVAFYVWWKRPAAVMPGYPGESAGMQNNVT